MAGEKTSAFRVKLFGLIREAAANKEVHVSIEGDCITVGDLKRQLQVSFPSLASANAGFVVAVNRKVANDTTTVTVSDEIAVLPLVSGG